MGDQSTDTETLSFYKANVSFGPFRCDRVYKILPSEWVDAIREEWLSPFDEPPDAASAPEVSIDPFGNALPPGADAVQVVAGDEPAASEDSFRESNDSASQFEVVPPAELEADQPDESAQADTTNG